MINVQYSYVFRLYFKTILKNKMLNNIITLRYYIVIEKWHKNKNK